MLVLADHWRCLEETDSQPLDQEKYFYQHGVKHPITVLVGKNIESRQPIFRMFRARLLTSSRRDAFSTEQCRKSTEIFDLTGCWEQYSSCL